MTLFQLKLLKNTQSQQYQPSYSQSLISCLAAITELLWETLRPNSKKTSWPALCGCRPMPPSLESQFIIFNLWKRPIYMAKLQFLHVGGVRPVVENAQCLQASSHPWRLANCRLAHPDIFYSLTWSKWFKLELSYGIRTCDLWQLTPWLDETWDLDKLTTNLTQFLLPTKYSF